MLFQPPQTPTRTIMMTNPGNRVQAPGQNPKIVFVTQRPQTPITTHQIISSSSSQTNTVVKFVSAPGVQHPSQKVVNAASKILVMNMPGASHTNTAPSQTQPPISVVPKPMFAQQTIKVEQVVAPPDIDDLSHLA